MKTLRETLTKHASRKSTLMTDDSPVSRKLRKEFKAHGVVVHSKGEYVSKDGLTHTQTIESLRHPQARHQRLVPLGQRTALAALR